MPGIKSIWFDLDDTLFDHTYSLCRGLDAVRSRHPGFGERPSEDLAVFYNRALNAVYSEYILGEIDFREMRRRKLKLFYQYLEVDERRLPGMDEFHHIYDEGYRLHRRATPGSVELLERLKGDGIELGILTNGSQVAQQEKLGKIGLAWMAPHLLSAEQARVCKPDPRVYRWALEQRGRRAEEVLMVGDNLKNDVEAALACGLSAIFYSPKSEEPSIKTTYGVAPVITRWDSLLGWTRITAAVQTVDSAPFK